jgi:hypothetical protein
LAELEVLLKILKIILVEFVALVTKKLQRKKPKEMTVQQQLLRQI